MAYAVLAFLVVYLAVKWRSLAHIFDRFYQAEAAHEYHQKGTGIGLAIAKEIVELHHGTIEAHSRETRDNVTEFIIRLPLGNAHLEPGDQMEMNEKDIILVVEDSADLREHIKLVLEPLYQVLTAADGREGIEKAREFIPDLIVSDIMMPEVDGYELCRVLKNHRDTSHIPIILLTAKADEENIIQGLETGADDYITKPFNTNILFARIKNLVDLRRQYQETFQREINIKPVKKSVSQMDEEFISDLNKVINKNISEPEFNVEDLSRKMYMGRTTLFRKIRALTGVSPNEIIRSYRLNRGAKLLEKGMSVLEVALEVGFSSASHFSRCFSRKFHQSPTSYKASMAKSK